MPDVFFTSDDHFYHANIIKHCHRPFSSVEEMNEVLISNWNVMVGKHDTVYHLGDFFFRSREEKIKEIISRLHGHVHLILGNHDKKQKNIYKKYILSINDLRTIKIDGAKIVLCHYPLMSWDGSCHGSWHLHGHCHGTLSPFGRSTDVGVDNKENNFAPLSFETIRERLRDKQSIE